MKRAFCSNDPAYEHFFLMAGLNILTGEETAYAPLIGNEEPIKELIAAGTSLSDSLTRLENKVDDVREGR